MPQAPVAPAVNSPTEELANAVTHALGAVAAAIVATLLIVLASLTGEPWRIVTLSVFGLTLLAVYLTSALYHAARRPAVKRVLRRLDHAAIFLLIAGTYTPFMLVTLGGAWGWSVLLIVWALAAAGIYLKLARFGRHGRVEMGLKLVAGWMLLVAIVPMVAALSGPGLVWLGLGGAAYTVGIVFYLWHRLRFHHAVWHVFVLAGSACHVVAIWTDVLPVT